MTEEKAWHEGVPQPVDADGNVVPLATRTLYDGDGQEISVMEYALIYSKYTGVPVWHVRKTDGSIFMLDRFHLEPPDSWERLTADLELLDTELTPVSAACAYWNATQKPCRYRDAGPCSPCSPNHYRCYFGIIRDVLRRIKALREVDGRD